MLELNVFCSALKNIMCVRVCVWGGGGGVYVAQPQPVHSHWLIMEGNSSASHASVTSTHRSHLLRPSDVLQNLLQLLLDTSGPVNHPGKMKWDIVNLQPSTSSHQHVITRALGSLSPAIFVYLPNYASFQIPIWNSYCPSLLMSGLVIANLSSYHTLHISRRLWQDWRGTCPPRLGWDQRLCYKTAPVWQKCTLSRSWSPVDGANFGIKRSNGWSSSLWISQQATNDLMDQDSH